MFLLLASPAPSGNKGAGLTDYVPIATVPSSVREQRCGFHSFRVTICVIFTFVKPQGNFRRAVLASTKKDAGERSQTLNE